ncbi:NAD(P)/FAD-dependent oxidoreductase [Streptomyces sodiiphilus]|uniref:NAD(P)/FAD-dependent oxidoreductase n=1 Tax=Streptomyces sodiiphilus TaxID=226217 RepID=A0ABN2NUB1_9ACTN
MTQSCDVIIVGMGPAGERVAGELAAAGMDVVGVEARLLGGECPYWACVPTKMMVRAAGLLAEGRRIPAMAGSAEVRADFAPVAARIRKEATHDWDDTAAVERFTAAGGRFVRSHGRLDGPGRVLATDETGGKQEFGARLGVVLATGSAPRVPPVPGLAGTPFWTNREAVEAQEAPASMIVMGGGPVGVEFAQAFARFGTDVTVVEGRDRLLPGEEPESSRLVEEALRAEGVALHTGSRAGGVAHDDGVFTVTLDNGTELTAGCLLVATGRAVDLAALGVESVGLDPEATTLAVDERMLAAPALWGVGDITGKGPFTHVAMYQADIAVRGILGGDGPVADYRALPHVTFTDPEVGSVGLTEQAARDRGLTVRTGTADVSAAARGWIHQEGNRGLIKVVEDADRGVLVGATSVGPAGGEVLYGLAVAVQGEVPVDTLRSMIYAYPTFHRAVETALADLS